MIKFRYAYGQKREGPPTPKSASETSVLTIRGLRVAYRSGNRMANAVDGVDLDVSKSQTLGIVGESGSGKSTLALAIPLLVHLSGGQIVGGSIRFNDNEITTASDREMRMLRGRAVGMVFQHPLSSLNPVLSIGKQLTEGLRYHLGYPQAEAWERAIDLLREVRLPDAAEAMRRYPHELSGGMRQRVVIAIAIACRPQLLVADEPTTALDVTVQAQILDLLRTQADRLGLSTVFISHDIGVIAAIADRVGVMYAGRLVEIGPVRQVVEAPAHPYTWGLLQAVPRLGVRKRLESIPGSIPPIGYNFPGCRFVDRCAFRTSECFVETPPLVRVASGQAAACWHANAFDRSGYKGPAPQQLFRISQKMHRNLLASSSDAALLMVRGLSKHYRVRTSDGARVLRAVDNVDLDIRRGEVLGLVGESGCGKSTLARLLIRLIEPTAGQITFNGVPLVGLTASPLRRLRAEFQIIFQNPAGALNPRLMVEQILNAPLRVHEIIGRSDRSTYLRELLELVGLDGSYLKSYPHQLSGGQKQRVAIARALALQPAFIVCDEPVSALDVSTQAQVINLLKDLKEQLNLTYVFISHDLAAVQSICDRVAVMYLGKLVEIGPLTQVFSEPEHPYTRLLMSAVPSLDFNAKPSQFRSPDTEVPSLLSMPSGCRFHTRCTFKTEECQTQEPQLRKIRDLQLAACHHAPLGAG